MTGLQILGEFIKRERPGARQVTGVEMPSGAGPLLVAVEAGRMAAFVTWEEDRSFRRPLKVLTECLTYFHEVWLVTSVEGARLQRKKLPIEVGVRVALEGGLQLGVAHPASMGCPAVKDLVELLTPAERAEFAQVLRVSETPLVIAAAGSLVWGTAAFMTRLSERVGDRAGPAPCPAQPSPAMILRAASSSARIAPPVIL